MGRSNALAAIITRKIRHERRDYEQPVGGQVTFYALEAPHLRLLSEQRGECVPRNVDKRKFSANPYIGKIAYLDADRSSALLCVKLFDHSWRCIDSSNLKATLAKRDCDSASPDAELEGARSRGH